MNATLKQQTELLQKIPHYYKLCQCPVTRPWSIIVSVHAQAVGYFRGACR